MGRLADMLDEDAAKEEKENNDWLGVYDGTFCEKCGRERVMMCNNGLRKCEKCGRVQETPSL